MLILPEMKQLVNKAAIGCFSFGKYRSSDKFDSSRIVDGSICVFRSSFDWNSPPYDIPNMFAKPGTPCNDYIGYCDVFQRCREVDPSGPLATLRKFLLSDENLASFRRWMLDHWYAGSIVVFALFSMMVSFNYWNFSPYLSREGREGGARERWVVLRENFISKFLPIY